VCVCVCVELHVLLLLLLLVIISLTPTRFSLPFHPHTPTHSPGFKTRDFVQLYESPPTLVAVNCFQAQYDESVPELYAWLGDKN
jgi:hypothetical protein